MGPIGSEGGLGRTERDEGGSGGSERNGSKVGGRGPALRRRSREEAFKDTGPLLVDACFEPSERNTEGVSQCEEAQKSARRV